MHYAHDPIFPAMPHLRGKSNEGSDVISTIADGLHDDSWHKRLPRRRVSGDSEGRTTEGRRRGRTVPTYQTLGRLSIRIDQSELADGSSQSNGDRLLRGFA